MIDLTTESTLSLTQAAKLLPPSRRGRPVSLGCFLRWVLDGMKTPQGVIRLEAIRLGGRWLTSKEALQRFAEALTPRLDCRPQTPRSGGRRQRESERAAKQLQQLGI